MEIPGGPTPRVIRETGIAQVMTSTRVGEHPTALFTTGLPILQVALNVEVMTTNLQSLIGPLDGARPDAVITHANLVAYKQGNRGLIHYDVAGGLGGATVVLGKLYPDPGQAARVYHTMRSLADDVFPGRVGSAVPRPLGHVPELAMLVYVPVPGRFLSEMILTERAGEYMDMAGAWLAALHLSRIPVDRRFEMSTEMVNLRAWSALVSHHYPDQGTSASAIAGPLRDVAGDLLLHNEGPIHKDYHYQHILVDEGLGVIDFDEIRHGDPNFDVAHFVAHLRLLECRTPSAPEGLFEGLVDRFLQAYATHSGWTRDRRFPFFYAYTCLKVAKQLCTVRGVRPRPDGEEQYRQVRWMLQAGLRALESL